MSARWTEKPLGEVATLQRGFDLPVQRRSPGTVKVFAANGSVGVHDTAMVAAPGVITGRSGSIGKVHYSCEPFWPLNTALFVKNFHGNHPRWVYWLLRRIDLAQYSEGTGVPTLNRNTVHRVHVPVPPVEEQRRIAAVLDKADELRANRHDSLTLLNTIYESIFLEMFGDPISNLRGWPVLSFSDVCPTRLGKMLDQKRQSGLHRRPYLRNANVRWFGFDLTDVAEMDFDDADRLEFKVEVGDVLICEGGEPGRAAVWDGSVEDVYFQKALHRGRPDPSQATSTYVVHLLWNLATRGGLVDHISSATIAHLTGVRLKSMRVPVPDLDLQRHFESRLAGIDGLARSVSSSEQQLNVLFSSLLDRAFAGQL